MKRVCIAIFVALCSVGSASATTYYVRTDGSNTNAGTSNTAGGAWQTIGKCLATGSTLVAGDVCRVQAGTYSATTTVAVSGTAGNTITLVADGVVTTCGMSFSAKSYVRVIGVIFNGLATGCSSSSTLINGSGTNTGLEFWNDTVENTTGKAYGFLLTSGTARCDQCIWVGGTITNINQSGTSGQIAWEVDGNDVFAGYLSLSNICYVALGPAGDRMRLVNNDVSAMVGCGGTHPDFYYPVIDANSSQDWSDSLVESTFGIGTASDSNNKFEHAQNQQALSWLRDVFRQNAAVQLGSSVYSAYTSAASANNDQRWYNNTWVQTSRAAPGNSGCGTGAAQNAGTTLSMFFWNELYYECWAPALTSVDGAWEAQGGSGTTTITLDYNLGFDPDGSVTFFSQWNSQTHKQSNIDPKLTNVAGDDFTLLSTSGARGVGGPITTATSCGGTTLNVASGGGGLFKGDNSSNLAAYSGALMPGDTITVGTSTTRKVVSISGDAITVDSSLTCSAGDPVYFGDSSTIDIGAYPYKSGGYTLSATYTVAGGTATITPNDASLVRFVVCYDSNVPTAVVNAGPYTCPTGSGTFKATVYPRYASLTQGTDATFNAGNQLRPLRNMIIRGDWALLGAILPIAWRTRRRA